VRNMCDVDYLQCFDAVGWAAGRASGLKKQSGGVLSWLSVCCNLHMAQLMQLPLTVSCFSKIQTGFTFLVPAHPGSPGQRACVCVCVCNTCDVDTNLRLPWPSFPSSPSPQENTSPSADSARQCLPPELTASFLMNTCWTDSSRVGHAMDSVPPTPSRPPAPYPVAYT